MKPHSHSAFLFSAILLFATTAFAQEQDDNPSSSTLDNTGAMTSELSTSGSSHSETSRARRRARVSYEIHSVIIE